jgi:hypothetical protein
MSVCYHLCLDSEVTDVTGQLLDAREGRARDLVAAESGINADEDTGLANEVSFEAVTQPTCCDYSHR